MSITQAEAIELCRQLEPIAAEHGGHVALTGGCLYKDGTRKDVDILVYRSADEDAFKWPEFFRTIEPLGITHVEHQDYGFCKKAVLVRRLNDGELPEPVRIDFFDPFGENKAYGEQEQVTCSKTSHCYYKAGHDGACAKEQGKPCPKLGTWNEPVRPHIAPCQLDEGHDGECVEDIPF
jgi:hypothetical protein